MSTTTRFPLGLALTNPIADSSAGFGTAVALSETGLTAVVSGPSSTIELADGTTVTGSGAALVYDFDTLTGTWALRGSPIFPSDTFDGAEFGVDVDISADGNRIALSSVNDFVDVDLAGAGTFFQGSVRIFDWDAGAGEWELVDTVGIVIDPFEEDPEFDGFESFGSAISLSDDGRTLVVGLPDDTINRNVSGSGTLPVFSGSAQIFTFNTSTNEFVIKGTNGILPAETINEFDTAPVDFSGSDGFGAAVDVASNTGRTTIVGSPFDDFVASDDSVVFDHGGIRIYSISTSTFNETLVDPQILFDDDYDDLDIDNSVFASGEALNFGRSVAISDDAVYIIAGAPGDDVSFDENGNLITDIDFDNLNSFLTDNGSAIVYKAVSGNYVQQGAPITALTEADGAFLGSSVAISDDGTIAVVGAPGDTINGVQSGSARVFQRTGSNAAAVWTEIAVLVAPNAADGDAFGTHVSISGDGSIVIVGGPGGDTADASDQGLAYVFKVAADVTAPLLLEQAPINGGISVPIDQDLFFEFNEFIQAGVGSIALKNDRTGVTITFDINGDEVFIEQNRLLLDIPTLAGSTTYSVTIASGVIEDLSGNDYAGLAAGTFTFTTASTTTVNNPPIAVDDAGAATEAGGVNNGTTGTSATGTVLDNDTDADVGASLSVASVRTGTTEGAGTAGTLGVALAGAFGLLTLNADGSYSYAATDANATVNALAVGQTLTDSFNYTVTDGSLTDTAVLTIAINGANDAPVAVNDSGAATEAGGVDNGTPGSNATGDVLANDTDVDAGSTRTVSAIRTGGTEGAGTAGSLGAALNGQYGALTLNADGSYAYVINEANATVNALAAGQTLTDSFNYTVTDGSLTDTAVLTITINGANDAPTITSAAAYSVGENQTAVGTSTASDPDAGTSLTWSIAGGVDAALFTIDASTGAIAFATAPNFEAPADAGADNVYDLVLKVSDGTLSATQVATVTVTNVNETPTITSAAAYSIGENQTAVGTATASDPDAGTTFTWSIAGGVDAALFTIDASTGAIAFATAANFEAPADAGADNVYDLVLKVSDGTLSATQAATVTVTNVNETPTITSAAAYSVGENQTAVGTATASDPDAGTTFTWTIAGGADAALFTIDASTGAIAFATAANFEAPTDAGADNVYDLVLKVSDGTLSATQAATVTVTNVNETPTITSAAAYSVGENQTAVGTATASDPDAGTTFTWTIAGGVDAALFTIDASTGAIAFATAPNFEAPADAGADNVYDLVLKVSDGTLSATQVATVTVTDVVETGVTAVDDAASALEAGGDANTTPGSTAAGNVLTNDSSPTAGRMVTAIRSGSLESAGTSGSVGGALAGAYGTLTLNADGSFSYVVDDANLTVDALPAGQTLTDGFNYTVTDGALSDTAVLTITINGANDAPVAVNDGGSATEAGGANPGTNATGDVLANDIDVDTGSIRTVSAIRTGGTEDAGTAGSLGAALNGQYGALTLNADGSYSYAVNNANPTVNALAAGQTLTDSFNYTVTDGSLTDTAVLTITINGANDAPTITSAAAFSIAENQTAVGTATASDPDAGTSLTWSIAGGADAALFTINALTGAIAFVTAPDFEAPGDSDGDNIFVVTLSVSDGMLASSELDVTVTVTDVNEAILEGRINGTVGSDILNGTNKSNEIFAGKSNDTLRGYAGDDLLDGGAGADCMVGGTGNDIYVVDNSRDRVIEVSGATDGTEDLVRSLISYRLPANVEGIQLLNLPQSDGTEGDFGADLTATGGGFADILIGNSGNNTLTGAAGDDVLTGGDGFDVFVVAAKNGTDTITDFQAGDTVRVTRAVLKDTSIVASGTAATTLTANQVLIEQDGSDTLLHIGTDKVAGADVTVRLDGVTGLTAADLVLRGADITRTGGPSESTQAANTINGGTGDDLLLGLGGNDKLSGGDGNDTLDGGDGSDVLTGGSGDDVYVVERSTDRVVELVDGGSDTIRSWVSYKLPANVERLELLGIADLTATGGTSADWLVGNAGSNVLTGAGGDDSLTGGDGNDVFVVATKNGTDTITDLSAGDTIRISGASLKSFVDGATVPASALTAGQVRLEADGSDTLVQIGVDATGGVDVVVRLTGTYEQSDLVLFGTDILAVDTGAALGSTVADTLFGGDAGDTLLGAEGNDKLFGLAGNDYLDGGAGNDSMIGGSGDDTYIVNASTDRVFEDTDSGNDRILSNISLSLVKFINIEELQLGGLSNVSATGSAGNDRLIGNRAHNTLNGGAGDDSLVGGDGADVFLYAVANNGSDVIEDFGFDDAIRVSGLKVTSIEAGNGASIGKGVAAYESDGDDVIIHIGTNTTAGSDVEIRLKGAAQSALPTLAVDNGDIVAIPSSGSAASAAAFASVTVGGAAAESLSLSAQGTLFGLGGNDTLSGAVSDDTLVGGSGNDKLFGQDGADKLHGGTGNDQLYGDAGNDTLDGGFGSDVLTGGAGDDVYLVDSASDRIVEGVDGGTDSVVSTTTYRLAANVENLTLLDTVDEFGELVGLAANINGTGNKDANIITGNAGNNSINGDAGNDQLVGKQGNDTLVGGIGDDVLNGGDGDDVFQFASTNNGLDLIEDLSVGDLIRVSGAKFSGVVVEFDGSSETGAPVALEMIGTDEYILHVAARTASLTAGTFDFTIMLSGKFAAEDFALSGSDILFLG